MCWLEGENIYFGKNQPLRSLTMSQERCPCFTFVSLLENKVVPHQLKESNAYI